MSSLESCVGQHIRNLVSALTNKKQYKATAAELQKIVSTFGTAAEKLLLGVLLQEIDFKDPRTAAGSKDQFKVQFLKQAISNLSERAEFVDYFSQVFPSGEIEEVFEEFVKTLHLALPAQLLLALSISMSSTPHVARAGIAILKAKVAEYHSLGKPQRIPAHSLHSVLYVMRTHPEFTSDRNTYNWIQFLLMSNPVGDNTLLLPLLQEGPETFNQRDLDPRVMVQVSASLGLSEVLEDLGPLSMQNEATLREIFSEFRDVKESEMAEVLAVMCEKCAEVVDFESRVVSATFSALTRQDWDALNRDIPDRKAQLPWNVDAFCKVVKETYNLHWEKVVEKLDIPKFVIKSDQAFNLLVNVYFRTTGKQFPVLPFFKLWKNPRGQVSFLMHSIYSQLPQEAFNFNESPNKIPLEDVAISQEVRHIIQAFSSQDLLTTLVELSVTEFYTSIKNLFMTEADRFPDIMLISMSTIKPRRGQSLLSDVLSKLLSKFFPLNNSNPGVLYNLWESNPDLLIKGAIEYYYREPNTITLNHLIDLTQEIKESLLTLAKANDHLFAVHFGLLASKKDYLHLEHWLTERISQAREEFLNVLCEFLESFLIDPSKESPQVETIMEKACVSKEGLVIMFEKISELIETEGFSEEVKRRVAEVYRGLCNIIPELQHPVGSKEDVDDAANEYFKQLYSEEISVDGMVEIIRKLRNSSSKHENEIFDCMIKNLMDEYRFFHKYPEKELQITGELYGKIIKYGFVAGVHLYGALKQVIMSLQKPMSKLYRFGMYALEQFIEKLAEWPNYAKELLANQSIKQERPDLYDILLHLGEEEPKPKPKQETILAEGPPGIVRKPEPKEPEPESKVPKDTIMFILNTISLQNVESKSKQLQELLLQDTQNNIPWFANYLVVTRVSQEHNFHGLYLKMLMEMELKQVNKTILEETYNYIKNLLSKEKLEESDRKILNSLGTWLGSMTLSRNKPIFIKHLDLKDLLIQAYAHENLLAIIPFICNIIKAASNSEVFSKLNPWLIAVVSVLVEIRNTPNLKMRISHEIEVLLKDLRITPEEVPKTSLLTKEVKKPPEAPKQQTPTPESLPLPADDLMLANLDRHVTISPKITELYPEMELKKLVAQAIEKAIKEIIQPIVHRNMNIALITTKELILKDFSMEKDHNKLQQASHWMVQSLAGSLAQVTSREPFRVHVVNFLNELLRSSNTLSNQAIKQIVELASIDNLELGCGLIAKIVIKKALDDVNHEESLNQAINKRKQMGDNFYDEQASKKAAEAEFLPENLKPKPTGLTHEQFQVYKEFLGIVETSRKSTSAPIAQDFPKPVPYQETRTETLSPHQAIRKFDEQLEETETLAVAKNDFEDSEVKQAMMSVTKTIMSSVSRTETVAACAQKLFRRCYTNEFMGNFYLQILQLIKSQHRAVVKDITNWLKFSEDNKKYYWPVTSEIIKGELVQIIEFDKVLSKGIEVGNMQALQFAVKLIREFVISQKVLSYNEVSFTLNALKLLKEKQPNIEELNKILGELAASSAQKSPMLSAEQEKLRDVAESKFLEWLSISLDEPFINSEKVPDFVKSLDAQGCLSPDDRAEFVFRVMAELAIKKSTFEEQIDYSPIDAFSKLLNVIIILSRQPEKHKRLFQSLLNPIKELIIKNSTDPNFKPRPYFRILLDILSETTQPTDVFPDQNQVNELLIPIANTFHELNPCKLPAFSFCWLELVSHRFFMPKMLRTVNLNQEPRTQSLHWKKMHTLMMDLFKFIYLHFSKTPISEALREFYQGVLRVLLVLMHDFPEFLCDYYLDFCDFIPEHCVQLKNLVLSAYPQNMRMPLPFTPNLKVDLLPEMNVTPNVLSNYHSKLGHLSIKDDIDQYLLGQSQDSVKEICNKLMIPDPNTPSELMIKANIPVINATSLYIAEKVLSGEAENKTANELYLAILLGLETEARKHLINALANHLRFPNSHTKYFSCLILVLFVECKQGLVEEQVTRVLTERAIVHRPHPWGILITLIELIRNPKYEFLKKPFIRSTPEIEKLYEKMIKSCAGPVSNILNQ